MMLLFEERLQEAGGWGWTDGWLVGVGSSHILPLLNFRNLCIYKRVCLVTFVDFVLRCNLGCV